MTKDQQYLFLVFLQILTFVSNTLITIFIFVTQRKLNLFI